MEQILVGLRDLDEQSLIHRDIKPDNIMVDIRDDGADVHFVDLGLCKPMYHEASITATFDVGNPLYRAPECYPYSADARPNGSPPDQYGDPQYGTKADLFSAGLIFNQMIHPHWVLSEVQDREDLRLVHKEGHFGVLTDEETGVPGLAAIINSMVETDPAMRGSVGDLLDQMTALRIREETRRLNGGMASLPACPAGVLCPDLTATHRQRWYHPTNPPSYTESPDPFAGPLFHTGEGVQVCCDGQQCPFLIAYLDGNTSHRVMDHISVRIHLPREPCDGVSCPLDMPGVPHLWEAHLWEYSHKGIPDIRSACGDGCKRWTDIRHVKQRAHSPSPLPLALGSPAVPADFRRNYQSMRVKTPSYSISNLVPVVQALRPTHRLSLATLELVLGTGFLMSRQQQKRISEPGFLSKRARLHPYIQTLPKGKRSVVADYMEVCTALRLADTGVSTMGYHERLQKDSLATALGDEQCRQLDVLCQRIVTAASTVSQKATGIGYEVDHLVSTDDSIFTVIGPNTNHRYGEALIVFRPSVMRHPHSDCHWSAATFYVTQAESMHQCGRPFLALPGKPLSQERVDNYHRNRFSVAERGTTQLLADEMVSMLKYAHLPPTERGAVEAMCDPNVWESHTLIEGHLPSTLGLDYVQHVVLDTAGYDSLSEESRHVLEMLPKGSLVVTDWDRYKKCLSNEYGGTEVGYQFGVGTESVRIPGIIPLETDPATYIVFSCHGQVYLNLSPLDTGVTTCVTIRFLEDSVDVCPASIEDARDSLPSDSVSSSDLCHLSLDKLSFRRYRVRVTKDAVEVERIGQQKQTTMPALTLRRRNLLEPVDYAVRFASSSEGEVSSVEGCILTTDKEETLLPVKGEMGSTVMLPGDDMTIEYVNVNHGLECWNSIGCSMYHDKDNIDQSHVAAYTHVCHYGSRCKKKGRYKHDKNFLHPKRPMCTLGADCQSRLGDMGHRLAFEHPDIQVEVDGVMQSVRVLDVPYHCSLGEDCPQIADPVHLAKYSHWPMDLKRKPPDSLLTSFPSVSGSRSGSGSGSGSTKPDASGLGRKSCQYEIPYWTEEDALRYAERETLLHCTCQCDASGCVDASGLRCAVCHQQRENIGDVDASGLGRPSSASQDDSSGGVDASGLGRPVHPETDRETPPRAPETDSASLTDPSTSCHSDGMTEIHPKHFEDLPLGSPARDLLQELHSMPRVSAQRIEDHEIEIDCLEFRLQRLKGTRLLERSASVESRLKAHRSELASLLDSMKERERMTQKLRSYTHIEQVALVLGVPQTPSQPETQGKE
ncbi:hypothetical protein KIPB_006122 [Kipferlia bialata]|uniref:Protein kinase domain-containing protein n=1 Tax=Kipferlia bialata TaxID=797122 RepID=A0A9K3GJ06_9EUKA|nr:hypothetical protein KIPB_006122 [Kipferlia bialata]|eukprot:g6122.t1